MKTQLTITAILITAIVLLIISTPAANASLCQRVAVSLAYPYQTAENQVVPVSVVVSGSCVSDGEDYFAVRVDLVDNSTHTVLSSNSTPIGYNANNFSVEINNAALAPKMNESWAVDVDTYLIQSGATSGNYLLNATSVTIRVGDTPLPELPYSPSLLLTVALLTAALTLSRNRGHRKRNKVRLCTGN